MTTVLNRPIIVTPLKKQSKRRQCKGAPGSAHLHIKCYSFLTPGFCHQLNTSAIKIGSAAQCSNTAGHKNG